MVPELEALIRRGLASGVVTYDDINTAFPDGTLTDETLQVILEQLENRGISLIDESAVDESVSPAPATDDFAVDDGIEWDGTSGLHRRHHEFEAFLRSHDIPFSDAVCSFEPDGRVFDAELIVPGDRALEAWWKLRNAPRPFPFHPVILPTQPLTARYGRQFADQLDPGLREWNEKQERRKRGETPLFDFEIDTATIRADAKANIAAAAGVSPEPWTFRNRGPAPVPENGADEEFEGSVPDPAVLFSNAGPFLNIRQSYHPSYPILAFVRIRLYPATEPWEVFAYAPRGGWNDAPWPDEQLAMFRHWHDRLGAELVTDIGDAYELFVPRPPRTRHAAIRLYHEMTHFGEETFLHPVRAGDLEECIARVRASHYWYFWWD